MDTGLGLDIARTGGRWPPALHNAIAWEIPSLAYSKIHSIHSHLAHKKQAHLAEKIAVSDQFAAESPRAQTKKLESLLVEQRIGISAVLSTPLIELPIQKQALFVA